MLTTTHYCEQGTYEWKILKLGYISASNADKIMVNELLGGRVKKTAKSGKFGVDYQNYLTEKITELMTEDHNFDTYVSPEMQWGIDNEPIARAEYSARNMVVVDEVGFISCDEHYIGISPDGLIRGFERGLEIKNFGNTKHMQIVLTGQEPAKVYAQCQQSMMVTGYPEWDFVSYNRRMKPEVRYFQKTIKRDEEYIDILQKKATLGSNHIKEVLESFK